MGLASKLSPFRSVVSHQSSPKYSSEKHVGIAVAVSGRRHFFPHTLPQKIPRTSNPPLNPRR